MTTQADTREEARIVIQPIERQTILVPIQSVSPLITHAWSEKAKETLKGSTGHKKQAKVKEDRNPQAEYEGAMHRFDDGGYGFPTLGFKAATISAARLYDGVSMAELKQLVYFTGETGSEGTLLTRFDTCKDPWMRSDVVRLTFKSTDMRYRPQIDEWTAQLAITFLPNILSRDSIVALVNAGGLTAGIGEWRPSKGGDYGQYQVDDGRDIVVVGDAL